MRTEKISKARRDRRHDGMAGSVACGDGHSGVPRLAVRLYIDACVVAGEGLATTWTDENPHANVEIGHIVGQPHHRLFVYDVFVDS